MLRSMTGYGNASAASESLSISVEIRAVNNRHLKTNIRCPDSYAPLESQIEKLIRSVVSRGTISVSIKADRLDEEPNVAINRTTLMHYWEQISNAAAEVSLEQPKDITPLLSLPGVFRQKQSNVENDLDAEWQIIEQACNAALDKFNQFRADEGRSMQEELLRNCQLIDDELVKVSNDAPQVVVDYRDKLLERVNQLLEKSEAQLEETDIIKEVSIYADRCDINEEITRLRCHIEQMREFLQAEESLGKKMEFLCQEMFREVNTIGSKSNLVSIARSVVEMKSAVEKMRELVMNIE